ncbi:MAG TPA: tetratricopeptide repeat protein [Acidobacteriota bacterium]|nr:tetratricopeptide repeat protein [Acidobacteriota bacterium]
MMKRNHVVLFLILSLTLAGLTSCSSFKAKMLVKKGNELYEAKKFDEAIAKYQEALKLAPDLYTIWENIGLANMAMYVPGSTHPKDVEYANNAISAFKEYLKHDPENPQVNEFLITMYLNAERKDDAIQYFEDYMKKKPDDKATMQKLAFLYAQTGNFDQALKWYQKRAAVDPTNAEAYYIIGVICWEKSYKTPDITPEEREKIVGVGMQNLDKAISINPNYADAYLYENLLYREKAKLISTDPNNIPPDKVDEYNALLDKAKQLQQKAIELRGKSPAS